MLFFSSLLVFSQPGLLSSPGLTNVALATIAGDLVYLAFFSIGRGSFTLVSTERSDRPALKITLIPCFPHTDACCVRQHHQRGAASIRWQVSEALLTLRRPSGRVNEGTWVATRPQHLGKVVFFLLQFVLFAGDGSCPVIQAPDQTSLDMGWVVGLEVQVAVGMGGLPVDSDVQATILPLAEQGVQEWEHSILLYLDSELD